MFFTWHIWHIWSGIQVELVDRWRLYVSAPCQTSYHNDPKGLLLREGAKSVVENQSCFSQWEPGPEWYRCTAHVPAHSTASGLHPLYCWSIFHCHTFALEIKENILNKKCLQKRTQKPNYSEWLHIYVTCRRGKLFLKAYSANEITKLSWHTLVEPLRLVCHSLPIHFEQLF